MLSSEIEIQCPYCFETQHASVDSGGADEQDYTEDCQVCCKPMRIHVEKEDGGEWDVTVDRES